MPWPPPSLAVVDRVPRAVCRAPRVPRGGERASEHHEVLPRHVAPEATHLHGSIIGVVVVLHAKKRSANGPKPILIIS